MNKTQKYFYITTSIPYINGDPHIGHTYELVAADVLARVARKKVGHVLLVTGTDEHGGKIQEKANELGKPVIEYVNEMSARWRELGPLVNMSNDRFIRTTDVGHEQRAALIWKALEKDIYKSRYSGWYCTGCEEFVTEATAKENNGTCPIHKKPYEKVEEDNYFFKLSAYADEITAKIMSGEFRITPDSRKNEILHVLKEGLDDISISRPKEKLSWGVPVPGDKDQVMYVWFEALMNYITVLGFPEHEDFKKYWPANIQVIGKDIIRFHAAIWPGMLLALGVPLPKQLYVHGFVNINGQKISKSLGNVIHPREVIDKYSVDSLRYFLMRHVPSYGDGDFTWQRFEEVYNNELANELGNAVSRTAAMIIKYQHGIIGDIPGSQHDIAQYEAALEDCRFDKALEEVWEQVRGLNQYIEEEKPWVLAKNNDSDHLREVLAYMTSNLLEIAELLEPFMPETAQKISYIFSTGVVQKIEGTLFPKHETPEVKE
jgi:methionyl-tRNA synthetase